MVGVCRQGIHWLIRPASAVGAKIETSSSVRGPVTKIRWWTTEKGAWHQSLVSTCSLHTHTHTSFSTIIFHCGWLSKERGHLATLGFILEIRFAPEKVSNLVHSAISTHLTILFPVCHFQSFSHWCNWVPTGSMLSARLSFTHPLAKS